MTFAGLALASSAKAAPGRQEPTTNPIDARRSPYAIAESIPHFIPPWPLIFSV